MFLGLVSADLVRILYGPAWAESGWVLGILFMSMPAYVIWGLSTPVLWNTGRKHQEFALQLPLVAVGALGFYVLAGQGLRMAASVAAGLLVLRAVVIALAALRALQLHPGALLPHAGRGLLLGSLCAVGVWLGQIATVRFDSALASLTASGLLSLTCVSAALACWPARLLGEPTIDMLLRFLPQLANVLNRCAPPRADALGEQRS
jgi:O-antigen/teichoic acid export membrane protein